MIQLRLLKSIEALLKTAFTEASFLDDKDHVADLIARARVEVLDRIALLEREGDK